MISVQLCIVHFVLIIFGLGLVHLSVYGDRVEFPDSPIQEPPMTVEDCRVLKQQMDLRALELDSLLKRLENLEGTTTLLQSNVTNLSDMVDTTVFLITGLNISEAALSKELQSTTGMLLKMNSSMEAVRSNQTKMSTNVRSMSRSVSRMNATMRHMKNMNQVWRNNFRVVNNTFRNIRKKVDFPAPTFNLGKAWDDEATW